MLKLLDLLTQGEAALKSALSVEQEGLTPDFKSESEREGGRIFDNGRLTKSGRTVIGQALSAFSNSAGGLLVIGVDCRAIDGVDCAQSLVPIANAARALSSLQSTVRELLQPRNDGIEVHFIPHQGSVDSGYFVIDVPRSERRPHRCEAAGSKQYFKRSGGSSFAMEHYDIEDAFQRTGTARLSLHHGFFGINASDWAEYRLSLVVRNDGQASAKHVVLPFRDVGNVSFSIRSDHAPVGEANAVTKFDSITAIAAPGHFVVHPGQQRVIEILTFKVEGTWNNGDAVKIAGINLARSNLCLECQLFSENSRPVSGIFRLSDEELEALTFRKDVLRRAGGSLELLVDAI